MLEAVQLLSPRSFGLQDGKWGRERQRGGTSGNKQEAGVGAQAEGWGEVESRRPASSTAFGLETYLAGSPSFWGIRFSGEPSPLPSSLPFSLSASKALFPFPDHPGGSSGKKKKETAFPGIHTQRV